MKKTLLILMICSLFFTISQSYSITTPDSEKTIDANGGAGGSGGNGNNSPGGRGGDGGNENGGNGGNKDNMPGCNGEDGKNGFNGKSCNSFFLFARSQRDDAAGWSETKVCQSDDLPVCGT